MKVAIDWKEYAFAARAGFQRQMENLVMGRKQRHQSKGEFDDHIRGAIGEYVVSKGLQLWWGGPGILSGRDVGDVQVRATKYDTGHLLLHDDDEDDQRFYLVTGGLREYRICGWILGKDGKALGVVKALDKEGKRPCICVEQGLLRPI